MSLSREPRPASFHRASLTDREALLFEAGIKLGGLFHQDPRHADRPNDRRGVGPGDPFRGRAPAVRPIGPGPHRPVPGQPLGHGPFRYRYLTAEMLSASVTLSDGRTEVTATLRHRPELRYPLMSVTKLRRAAPQITRASPAGRRRGRSARRTPRSAGSAGGPGTPRARGRSSRRPGSQRRAA